MNVPQVVVDLDKKSRIFLQEGLVLDHRGAEATVRWADGSISAVRLGVSEDHIMRITAAGGLVHQQLRDPVGASELARSSPAQAFVYALLDSSKPLSSKDLIARVEKVFDGDVSALWKRARQTFEAHKNVKSSGKGATLKYAWIGQPELDVLMADLSIQTGPRTGTRENALQTRLDAGNLEQGADAMQVMDNAVGSAVAPETEETGAPSSEAVHPAVELVRASASGQLPDNWLQLMSSSLHVPLAAGLALESLSDNELRKAVPALGKAALVLQALPRRSKALKAIDPVELAGPDAATALIDAARTELRELEPTSTRAHELKSAKVFLLRRILTSPSVGLLKLDTVLRAIQEVQTPHDAATHGEWVAGVLAAVVGAMDQGSWQKLTLQHKSAVARQLAAASLGATGSRASVLGWIWRNCPADLADEMWWRGVDFDDLAAVANTPLANALESEAIASAVVKPLVAKRLESATTRRHLLTALAAPPALARLMDEDVVLRSCDRVLREDTIARAWLVRLRNEARLSELTDELEALTRQAQEMSDLVSKAQEAVRLSEDRLRRMEARLADAAASTSELRESQVRQIRIDVMRAFAGLCAYVDGAAGSQPVERVRQRVRQMAAREGLTPSGIPGQTEPYDPRRHDIVGEAPMPQMPVTVTGIGYTWGEGADEIVLVRALVERTR